MWTKIKGFLTAIGSLVVLSATAIGVPAAFGDTHNVLYWVGLAAVVALVIAPIAVCVFGIPAVFCLERYRRCDLRDYVWTGFGISAALAVLSATTLTESEARGLLQVFETIIVLVAGPIAAAAYRKVTRPDLTDPKAAPPGNL